MTKNIRGENKYNKVGNTTLNISASYCRVRGRSREDPIPKRAAAKRSYPTSEVRGSGRECQAAMAQEQPGGATPRPNSRGQGRQLGGATHARSQGQQPGGPMPCPRSRGCTGAGGSRGAIPLEGQEGLVRRYPSCKIRSSGCTLLEQP